MRPVDQKFFSIRLGAGNSEEKHRQEGCGMASRPAAFKEGSRGRQKRGGGTRCQEIIKTFEEDDTFSQTGTSCGRATFKKGGVKPSRRVCHEKGGEENEQQSRFQRNIRTTTKEFFKLRNKDTPPLNKRKGGKKIVWGGVRYRKG